MLRPEIKKQKKIKGKIINQKTKFRNKKESILAKANTSIKSPHKERIDLIGDRTTTFLYNMQKRQKLNSLKEKSHKVSVYMNKLGEQFKTFNKNLNSESNPLMISNLTNISFRRSIFIRHQLKNIDKMNKEFDHEYNDPLNLNSDNRYKYNNLELKKRNDEYEKRIKKEKKIRDDNFKIESMKIFNILFKKGKGGRSFSDFKKNKKLNELKSNIDYVCGVEVKGQSRNNQNDSSKIPHYNIQMKSPSFIREKSKNASFTPSVKYNKSKVYFCKKYELSQEKIDKSKKIYEKIYSTIQTSPNKKIKYKIKGRNFILKTEQDKINKNNSSGYIISPIKKFNHQNNSANKENKKKINNFDKYKMHNNLPEIKRKEYEQYENNVFNTLNARKNTFITFSPKLRHQPYDPNLVLPKKNNTSAKELNNRCKTANNISHFKYDINENKNKSISNKKKFFPILKNLLDDNYNLKSDLKLGFNIITNMINDFKVGPKKKIQQNEINIEKLRKDLKLNNLGNVIDEIDVVMNNVKKMEKLVKKSDIYLLRRVAKTVIREDKLANKNLIFDNNTINAKLKKIYDRRKKKNERDENEDVNLDRQERIEMIKLFKNDGPDFFNEEYLSNLIKRYKTMKIK